MRDRRDPLSFVLERALDCVHCGLCLPACPSYELLRRESTAPRGRIHLARALAEGALTPTEALRRDLDLCLLCRACEPACPSGVRYGEMLESVRAHLLPPERGIRATWGRRLLHAISANPRRLRAILLALRLYERLGLRRVARRYGVLRWLGEEWALRDDLLPSIARLRVRPSEFAGPPSGSRRRGRVAILPGCVQPYLAPEIPRALSWVLRRLGFEVAVPKVEACCGALAAHAGERVGSLSAARRLCASLQVAEPFDALVVDAAGCGAHLAEWSAYLEREGADRSLVEAARSIERRTVDVWRFLSERAATGLTLGRVEERVAYADACHLAHAQGITLEPRRWLDRIPGLERVELADSDRCCGAAGLFAALHPAEALALVGRRAAGLASSGASLLAVSNVGCLLHWRAGLRRAGLPARALHPIQLIERSLRAADRRSPAAP